MKKFEKIVPKVSKEVVDDSYKFEEEYVEREKYTKKRNDISEVTDNVKSLIISEDNGKRYDSNDVDRTNNGNFNNNRKQNDYVKDHILRKNSKNNNYKDSKQRNYKSNNEGKTKFEDRRRNGGFKKGNNYEKSEKYHNNDKRKHDAIDEYDNYVSKKDTKKKKDSWYESDSESSYNGKFNDDVKDKMENKDKKLKVIEDDKNIRHSFSMITYLKKDYKIPNTDNNPAFPDTSMIVGIQVNGRVKTLRHFWCPKNLPVIELSVEIENGYDDIKRGDVSVRTKSCNIDNAAIYLIPNHRIQTYVCSKLVIVERFVLDDVVELTNVKVPYIDKKGILRISTTSKLNSNVERVILSKKHVQMVEIFAPSLQLFKSKMFKGELHPEVLTDIDDKSSYQYQEFIDVNVDFTDDENKEKAPYFIDLVSHNTTVDYNTDITSIESNLQIKHTYIYPNLEALARLNVWRE